MSKRIPFSLLLCVTMLLLSPGGMAENVPKVTGGMTAWGALPDDMVGLANLDSEVKSLGTPALFDAGTEIMEYCSAVKAGQRPDETPINTCMAARDLVGYYYSYVIRSYYTPDDLEATRSVAKHLLAASLEIVWTDDERIIWDRHVAEEHGGDQKKAINAAKELKIGEMKPFHLAGLSYNSIREKYDTLDGYTGYFDKAANEPFAPTLAYSGKRAVVSLEANAHGSESSGSLPRAEGGSVLRAVIIVVFYLVALTCIGLMFKMLWQKTYESKRFVACFVVACVALLSVSFLGEEDVSLAALSPDSEYLIWASRQMVLELENNARKHLSEEFMPTDKSARRHVQHLERLYDSQFFALEALTFLDSDIQEKIEESRKLAEGLKNEVIEPLQKYYPAGRGMKSLKDVTGKKEWVTLSDKMTELSNRYRGLIADLSDGQVTVALAYVPPQAK